MRAELEKLVHELGIHARVHFSGYQSESGRFLHVMNVFALTSESEGMPLAILEAWAAGLPVVASRVGGLPELIEGTGTGILFNSGDVEELAASIAMLLLDRERASRMGCAAQS